jgi:preprotein translocase subunit Sec61beta
MPEAPHYKKFTTHRYQETWMIFNPGKENYVRVSFGGIVKFYEHCWWSNIALRPKLIVVEYCPTFVIDSEQAIECSYKLRERYPYLEEVCQILDNGLTYIQHDEKA